MSPSHPGPLAVLAPQLDPWLRERGQPPFRARQIQRWLFHGGARTWADMSDLPAPLRQTLAQHHPLWQTTIRRHHVAADGTEKLVLELSDGGQIECVLLRDGARRSICVSSQVGCAMGCVFCASGLEGVKRNLTAGEIMEQMLRLQRLLAEGERLSHIVMMGMGEPLANLDAVLLALDAAADPTGLGISARRITISTVGIPTAMYRLIERQARYQLAVSLHAADDALRSRLVPINRQIGLESILSASDAYFVSSGRRLTFEYVLLGGINDRPQDAQRLAAILQHRTALLNLIPYNRVPGLPYSTPQADAVSRFSSILTARGINVQVRERKGDEISAACGQLRRSAADQWASSAGTAAAIHGNMLDK